MNRKFHSFTLMTDIAHSHLPFTKRIYWDFLEKYHLAYLSYHLIPSCPTLHIFSRMSITLLLGVNTLTYHKNEHWKFCKPGLRLNSERFFWPFSLMPLLSLQNIEILSPPFYFVVRANAKKLFTAVSYDFS